MQELLPAQVQYLTQQLSDYRQLGVGREGGDKGEYSAIYYDSTVLEQRANGTFWLSTTPDVAGPFRAVGVCPWTAANLGAGSRS